MVRINDPIKFKNLELANRLVMPPMATWKKSEDGVIPEELVEYYRERAGKMGLITLEYAYITEEGKSSTSQLSIASDSDIAELKKIVDAVHGEGTTKIIAQINHGGIASDYEVGDKDDVGRITKAFVDAALRTIEAGFDGVEIHAAHGYLLNQFYSPLANKRNDEYSAETIENRIRFAKEVVCAVRAAVGPDYFVSLRLGGCDYQEGGSTVKDAVEAVSILEAAGIDMISITGGMNGYRIEGVNTPGWFSDMSEAVKKAVSIPVLVTGGITTKDVADEILSSQKADLIGVGRAILADASVIDELLK